MGSHTLTVLIISEKEPKVKKMNVELALLNIAWDRDQTDKTFLVISASINMVLVSHPETINMAKRIDLGSVSNIRSRNLRPRHLRQDVSACSAKQKPQMNTYKVPFSATSPSNLKLAME